MRKPGGVPSFLSNTPPGSHHDGRGPQGVCGCQWAIWRSFAIDPSINSNPNVVKTLSKRPFSCSLSYENKEKCRGTDSNCRHRHFQCRALPPELPRRRLILSNPSLPVSRRPFTPAPSTDATRSLSLTHESDNRLTWNLGKSRFQESMLNTAQYSTIDRRHTLGIPAGSFLLKSSELA